mmetsp:Transcript_106015/g.207943  ORF Transcript_106015/g.207943 Transcript_106015/m.207943 type:complete len:230 (-) Transcript_106015:247-936(-)
MFPASKRAGPCKKRSTLLLTRASKLMPFGSSITPGAEWPSAVTCSLPPSILNSIQLGCHFHVTISKTRRGTAAPRGASHRPSRSCAKFASSWVQALFAGFEALLGGALRSKASVVRDLHDGTSPSMTSCSATSTGRPPKKSGFTMPNRTGARPRAPSKTGQSPLRGTSDNALRLSAGSTNDLKSLSRLTNDACNFESCQTLFSEGTAGDNAAELATACEVSCDPAWRPS